MSIFVHQFLGDVPACYEWAEANRVINNLIILGPRVFLRTAEGTKELRAKDYVIRQGKSILVVGEIEFLATFAQLA